MTNSPVETLYASEQPVSPALIKLRRFARPFEIGFGILAALAATLFLMLVILAYAPGGYVTFNEDGGWLSLNPSSNAPAGALPVTAFSPALQAVGFLTISVIYAALITALWSLHRLFKAYRKGTVFAPEPISQMRRAGFGLIVFSVAPGCMQPVLRALGSPDQNWFHAGTLPILITGAALFLFAQIIALGLEIERENKGFI